MAYEAELDVLAKEAVNATEAETAYDAVAGRLAAYEAVKA